MKRRERTPMSLRLGVSLVTIACWVVPVAMVAVAAGMFISAYYEDTLRQAASASATHAMYQTELRMAAAMEDSKSVSYDGEVRSAYRSYLQDGDGGALYRNVSDYLNRKFSRSERFDAVYVAFWDADMAETVPYVASSDVVQYVALQRFRTAIQPRAVACASGSDTGIYFLEADGELYMARNILDSRFEPYATLVMLCDTRNLFQSLRTVTGIVDAQIAVDGISLAVEPEVAPPAPPSRVRHVSMEYAGQVEGHQMVFTTQVAGVNIWQAIPVLKWILVLIVLLLLPMLGLVILLYYRHITEPVSVLVAASDRVEGGERGYQIQEQPRNLEFTKLYKHFNSMSQELDHQFKCLYQEQQALQQAKLRALQAQIDPHFLNNTLEVINWQARMEGNMDVSAMIEALSTMLNASIGRDGRARIPLREELSYADAYLYIIGKRLGERLRVTKEIDETLLEHVIPRLIIQPIVENAINHDIAERGGALCLRVSAQGGRMRIDVAHDGSISAQDRARIDALLSDAQPAGNDARVGIRNVNQRIRLIYGEDAHLTIEEIAPGRILARIDLPECAALVKNVQAKAKKDKEGPFS